MINSKKEVMLMIFFILFFVFISIPQASSYSRFFDRINLNSITGRAPSQTATVSITVGNNAPIIGNVTLDEATPISVTENGNKTLSFSFVVTDQEGGNNIVNNSAVANITATSEITRHNDTFAYPGDGGCIAANNVGANGRNFSCTIQVVFYDAATTWTINARINDSNGNFVQNITKTFSIQELTAITLDSSSITFTTITPNQDNISSSVNITIRNTGNDDISGKGTGETINITAITLVPSTGSTFIPASNFTIGAVNASSGFNGNYCDSSIKANVTRLQNTTDAVGFSNFSGAINGSSLIANAANNAYTLGLCLIHAPNDLQSTTYSTSSSGAWTILAF